MATDASMRSKGIGSFLIDSTIKYPNDNLTINNLIIEVDSTLEVNAKDIDIRKRKQKFYAKHGAKKIIGFKHILPFDGASYYPQMKIQIISNLYMDKLPIETLRKWIESIYDVAYNEPASHKSIEKMFSNTNKTFLLS